MNEDKKDELSSTLGGFKISIDPTMPRDIIEMRGANVVRANLRTGEVYEVESAILPPLTAPALPAAIPGTREQAVRDLMPKRAAFIEWCKARGIDTDVKKDAWGALTFKHDHVESLWTGWFNAPTEAPAEAAPAPQQGELNVTEAQISAAGRALADRNADSCGVNRDDNWMIYGGEFIEDARAAFAAAAKAAPAAPVQTADPIGFISRKTLEMLQGPDLAPDEHVRLWHAENPPSRAVIPVYLAAPVQAEQAQVEPIYQIYDIARQCWDDYAKEDYDGAPEDNRRIVYAAPAAAQAEQVAAVRAAYESAKKACEGERIEAMSHRELVAEDKAYNRAIKHCISAINYIATKEAAAVEAPNQAALDVLAERRRQIEQEGWTPQHDDEHSTGEMAAAAACYALHTEPVGNVGDYLRFWPWDSKWWKPRDKRRNLVKAGALILADIERLDRTPSTAQASKGESK
jgi:hypothetical protein